MTSVRRYLDRASAVPRLWVSIVLVSLFLVLPGAPASRFAGLPLSGWPLVWVAGVLTVILLGLLIPAPRTPPRWLILAILATLPLKVGLSMGVVPTGWRGAYALVEHGREQPIVFSAGVRQQPFRIDRQIHFDASNFALTFLNDFVRYGAQRGVLQRDVEVAFAVEWTGFVSLRRPVEVEMDATSYGPLRVEVDGAPWVDGGRPRESVTRVTRQLPAGPHEIQVRFEKPARTGPHVQLSLRDLHSGRPIPVWAEPASPSQQRLSRVLTRLTNWLGGIVLTLLGLVLLTAYWPPGRTLRLLRGSPGAPAAVLAFAGVLAWGLVLAQPFQHRTVTLWAGDDPFPYEGYARDIVFHGLLMPSGAVPGQGQTFYFYPFYSYLLALAHVLLGESFSTVIFLNFACLAAAVPLAWLLAFRGLAGWVSVAGVGLTTVFLLRHLRGYATTSITDVAFTMIVMAALAAGVTAMDTGRRAWWWTAGVLSALSAATRPSSLVFLGFFPVALLLVQGRVGWRDGWRKAGAFVAGVGLGLFPFALRNWIMARRLVLLVDSWIMLPYFLYLPEQKNPVSGRPGFAEAIGMTWAIFKARPAEVLDIEARKLGFTLGVTRLFPAVGVPYYPDLLALPPLFLLALLLGRMPWSLAVLLTTFAVSHVVAMLLAAPWTYGYKTIVPLHLVFLLGAVHLLPSGGRRYTTKLWR